MGDDDPRITVETIRCSFCGKLRDQVALMVRGQGVYLCDECADLVNEILEDKLPTWPWRRTPDRASREIEPRVRPSPSASVTTGPNTEVTIPTDLDDELTRLWIDFRNSRASGDTSALLALLEHYQPLADHYVDGLSIDRRVFEQGARKALVESVLWFDEQDGEPFETVALGAIRDAIYRALTVALELPKDLP